MIRAEQVPPEAWDKICEAFDVRPSEAKAALAAAINAWKGMEIEMVFVEEDYLILPLRKENTNG